MADASIVVCSDIKGGTWEGAREQLLKYRNNSIFAFTLDKKTAPGNAKLIKMGAHALDPESLQDIHIQLFKKDMSEFKASTKQYDFLEDSALEHLSVQEGEKPVYKTSSHKRKA